MKGIIYCRVSTQEQAEDGSSLITQERLCRDYAAKYGIEIVAPPFIEEGESAKTTKRTKLQEMMKYAKTNAKGIDVLIIYRIDRLSRESYDYESLKIFFSSCGIQIVSTSEPIENTPVGRFIEKTFANIAQLDNEIRGERSKNGMIEALKQGRYIFPAPIGYKKIGGRGIANIVPDEGVSTYIVEIFQEISSTSMKSLEDVRNSVNEQLKLKSLKPIAKSHFYKIIVNPVYKGWISLDTMGIHQKGSFKPLISEELFSQVQLILTGKSKKLPKYKKIRSDFPLRGTIRHTCGKLMTANWAKGKYPHYRCTHCSKVNLNRDTVEKDFVEYLHGINLKPALTEAIKVALELNWQDKKEGVIKLRTKLGKEKETLEDTQNQIVNKNIKGVFSDGMTKKLLNDLEMKKADIEMELMKYRAPEDDVNDLVKFSLKFLENMDQIWMQGTPEVKVQFQKFVFFNGVTYDQGKFRTDAKPLSVEMNETLDMKNYSKMTLRGIEPRLPG